MNIKNIFNDCGPHPGQTMEQYEKKQIRELLRMKEDATNPRLPKMGLNDPIFINGGRVPTDHDRSEEEVDRIYNESHGIDVVKLLRSRKKSTTK